MIEHDELVKLRADADRTDPEEHTRAFGTSWLKEKRSLALLVPSFVMPYERNVLINPLHPLVGALKLLRSERIRLDGRLNRGGPG